MSKYDAYKETLYSVTIYPRTGNSWSIKFQHKKRAQKLVNDWNAMPSHRAIMKVMSANEVD